MEVNIDSMKIEIPKEIILYEYLVNEKSVLQISKEIEGISYNRIYSFLKKESGIGIRSNQFTARKYQYNIDFFNVIDTEEKAYWLGFIYADGYITKRGNTHQLGISLGRVDKKHLEKFVISLGGNLKVHDYVNKSAYKENTEYSRVIISNNQICEQLMEKGVYRRKTNILKFPNSKIVPDSLINHFIRGYFDGDGCLTGSKHLKRDVYVYQVKITGTKEMLESINKNLPTNKSLYLSKRQKNNTNNYSLEIGGRKQVDMILEYLYNNSTVFLGRKYDKYLEFLVKS